LNAAIRRYRDRDRAAVYDVCVRTGNGGRGAVGQYSTDDLLPDIFAGPYLLLDPEHAYVVDNGERAVGYIVGTPDTAEFVAAYRARWIPVLATRYQVPRESPATAEDQRLAAMFRPESMIRPELAPYPAHLHINILPEYQGSGHGQALMEAFLASVAAAGARWCHLGVRVANTGAQAFYARLGWQPVDVPGQDAWIWLVRATS
jgi:ribosomal protein S18 acetylase RimI-like enzyme